MVTCVPEPGGTGAIATANWVQPVSVPGVNLLRYEFEWFFAAGTSRTGTESNTATTSAATVSGEYQQGETARFEVKAVFTDTNSDPDAARESELVTATGHCAVTPMMPDLMLDCDNDGVDASWSITVPQNVTITGYSYTVMFSGDEEELSETVGPDVTGLTIPSFGEVVTVTVVAHYRVVGDATVRDTVAATESCGIPHPITNLMVTCVPEPTGTGAIATANWVQPVSVPGVNLVRYEYEWFFDAAGTSRTGTESNAATTSATTTSGEYQQGETARFRAQGRVHRHQLQPRRKPGRASTSQPTGTARSPQWCRSCRWTCEQGSVAASWTIVVPTGITLTGFDYTVSLGVSGTSASRCSAPGPANNLPRVHGGSGHLFADSELHGGWGRDRTQHSGGVRHLRSAHAAPPIWWSPACPTRTGTGAIATANWVQPVSVPGVNLLRYEFEWFFDDDGTTRTGTESNAATTSAATTSGEYQQGETARFRLRAVFTDTKLQPRRNPGERVRHSQRALRGHPNVAGPEFVL